MRVWEGMAGMFVSSGLSQGHKANRRVLFDAKEAGGGNAGSWMTMGGEEG